MIKVPPVVLKMVMDTWTPDTVDGHLDTVILKSVKDPGHLLPGNETRNMTQQTTVEGSAQLSG